MRVFQQHTGFFLKKTFFRGFQKGREEILPFLGAVCHSLADTHTPLSRCISRAGEAHHPSRAPGLEEGSLVSSRFNGR